MVTKRRKGEKPISPDLLAWSEHCPVANMIRTGDRWFYAWIAQQNVRGFDRHSKQSSLSVEWLDDFWRGAELTEGELEALAGPLRTDVASLRSSVQFAREERERRGQRLRRSEPIADATAHCVHARDLGWRQGSPETAQTSQSGASANS